MFVLLSHLIAGKRYASILTQFIIGCSLYVISYLIFAGLCSDAEFDQIKYYALSLITLDVTFIVIRSHKKIKARRNVFLPDADIINCSSRDSVAISEKNNFKIMHDSVITDNSENSTIFSTSIIPHTKN